MMPSLQPGDNLLSLINAACSDTITAEQVGQLETGLRASRDACILYLRYVTLESEMHFLHKVDRADRAARGQITSTFVAPPELTAAPTLGFLTTALHGTIGYFSDGMPLAYLLATVITGLGLLIGSVIHVAGPEEMARQSATLPSPLSPLPSIVGRITGIVDCQWRKEGSGVRGQGSEIENPKSQIPNRKSLVALGDRFALSSGLMEITYDSGARVILQGPGTYEVEANGGYLAVGRLTGKLEKRGERREERVEGGKSEIRNLKSEISNPQSLIPNPFVIRTPTATVTDLGTEFTIEVKPNKATEVSVIRGVVEAVRDARTGGVPVHERLVAGEAIRFASLTDPPKRLSVASSSRTLSVPSPSGVVQKIRQSRSSLFVPRPTGIVAAAYHRVWDADGKLLAENDRLQAFRAVTDGKYGRGENNAGPRSSFDTRTNGRSNTDFVGLLYDHRIRFDRIKVFLGRQMGDGGNWAETPRVFILKHPVDTGSVPPEDDPADWRELPSQHFYGASFKAEADANPGAVIEFPLTGSSVEDARAMAGRLAA